MTEIENKLRELLLPVFGLSNINEVLPQHSLVKDLGAESIDFVEIAYIIESHFGVNIKTNELMIGGATMNPDELFIDGKLTAQGANLMNDSFGEIRFSEGQLRRDLFAAITVRDLARIIKLKKV